MRRGNTAQLRFVTVIAALAAAPALLAQAQLRVVVLEGEGALNNIRAAANPQAVTVEVRDAQQAPVNGASVTFVLPASGASGTFPDGSRSLSIDTDGQGRAQITGVRPNDQTGPLQIRVAASYLGQTATAIVNQTNVAIAGAGAPEQQSSRKGLSTAAKVLLVLAVVGGAAIGGTIAANSRDSKSGGGSTPGTGGITITPGTPSVGGPQ